MKNLRELSLVLRHLLPSSSGRTAARIANISVRGLIMRETAPGSARFGPVRPGSARFGLVAEEIARFQIGTARIALERGPGNDNLTAIDPLLIFGLLRDVTVREVTA